MKYPVNIFEFLYYYVYSLDELEWVFFFCYKYFCDFVFLHVRDDE